MPALECPFVMCRYNSSQYVKVPGSCLFSGTVRLEIVELDDDVQYLDCKCYSPATIGEKNLKESKVRWSDALRTRHS